MACCRRTLQRWLFCLGLAVGFQQLASADLAKAYYTTQTITFHAEPNTTITREAVTTTAPEYLKAILPQLPEPNASVIRLALGYPANGEHNYWWPKMGEGSYDGSTTDILINGQLVMKGEPEGRTYCCGLTLELFYRLLQDNPQLSVRIPADKFADFKGYWFCHDIFSPGPVEAMEAYHVGKRVSDLNDALPGDFIQLWRSNRSGHSVIFVNWIWGAGGKRVGIQYWSTQTATRGIGFRSEMFGDVPDLSLNIEDKLSVARPLIIN